MTCMLLSYYEAPPENLKFGEVRSIEPTDTSGSRKGLIKPPIFNTSAEHCAEKLQQWLQQKTLTI